MNLYCTRCGRPFTGSHICQNCGFQFDEDDIREVLRDQKKRPDNKNSGIIIAAILIPFVIIFFLIAVAIFVPALIGYKTKVDNNKRRAEYYQNQRESYYVSEQVQDDERINEDHEEEMVIDSSVDLSDQVLFESGEYEVGVDIPAGKYLVFSDDHSGYGDFCFGVYSQSDFSEESELSFEWYQGNAYVVLQEGTFIHFSHSCMYNVDNADISLKDLPGVNRFGGMYEVGKDIEPGRYKLEKTENQYSSQYMIYSSIDTSMPEIIEQNYSVEDNKEIYLSYGEYIFLKFGKPVKID